MNLAFVIVQGHFPHQRNRVLACYRKPFFGAPYVEIDWDPAKEPSKIADLSRLLIELVDHLSATSMDRKCMVSEFDRKVLPWGDRQEPTLCIFHEIPGSELVHSWPCHGGFVFDMLNHYDLKPDISLDFVRRDWPKDMTGHPPATAPVAFRTPASAVAM